MTDPFKTTFESFATEEPQPDWLSTYQKEGFSDYNMLGLPTRKTEDWKYLKLKPVLDHTYVLRPSTSEIDTKVIDAYTEGCPINLIFIDGQFSKEYSSYTNLPDGLNILNLSDAIKTCPDKVKSILEHHTSSHNDAFSALNQAFTKNGVLIHIEKNSAIKDLIQILHITSSHEKPSLFSPKNFIHVEENSRVNILESYSFFKENPYLMSPFTQLSLDQNANMSYHRLQNDSAAGTHFGYTKAYLKKGSHLNAFALSLGGKLSRHDFSIELQEEGSSTNMQGIYTARSTQVTDHHTSITHKVPNCNSHQLYKGILDHEARAVFNGKVIVHKDAQKTESVQQNKNLLLSKTCHVDTKPQLEIAADDVKCTHGATIGSLNDDELFYLNTRGIPRPLALTLLSQGFADDILNKVKVLKVRQLYRCLLLNFLANKSLMIPCSDGDDCQ
jgi:Fe-S cluster assembly protein SufD